MSVGQISREHEKTREAVEANARVLHAIVRLLKRGFFGRLRWLLFGLSKGD